MFLADSLGAGALAGRERIPILLTECNRLTAATRQYLESFQIDRVLVVGGTAAVSAATEAEVRSGPGVPTATEDFLADPTLAGSSMPTPLTCVGHPWPAIGGGRCSACLRSPSPNSIRPIGPPFPMTAG